MVATALVTQNKNGSNSATLTNMEPKFGIGVADGHPQPILQAVNEHLIFCDNAWDHVASYIIFDQANHNSVPPHP